MSRFTASKKIINSVINRMITEKYVSKNAKFNNNAELNLRSEVTYRDRDFLFFLGKTQFEDMLIKELINYLKSKRIISNSKNYDNVAFKNFRSEIKANFIGSWTSFSPVMEHILYCLTSLKQPNILLEFGSFWGNTLAWFAGPCIGKSQQIAATKIIGVDHNSKMCNIAIENFNKLPNTKNVQIINNDAKKFAQTINFKIDFLYLEAKSEKEPELALEILKLLENKLSDNAWIITHDIYDIDQMHHFENFLKYVKNKNIFSNSISLDVDQCGLELTIK